MDEFSEVIGPEQQDLFNSAEPVSFAEPDISEIEARATAPRLPIADGIQQQPQPEQPQHKPGWFRRALGNALYGVYQANQAMLGNPDLERDRLELARQQFELQRQQAERKSSEEKLVHLPAYMTNELGLDDGFQISVRDFPTVLGTYARIKQQAQETPEAIQARRRKAADEFNLTGPERTHYVLTGQLVRPNEINTPFEMWAQQNPGKPVSDYFKLSSRASGGQPIHDLPTVTGPDVLSALSPQESSLVKKVANYEIDAKSLSVRGGHRERILGLASLYDPTYDQTQFGSRAKLRQSANSGEMSVNIRRLNTAVGHLAGLARVAEQLENSDLTAWNSVANWVEKSTGDARVGRFETFANAVASEMSAVFKGTGAATDQEIKEWRKTLSSSQSPAQLKAAVESMLELMSSRLSAIDAQWTNGMGKPRDFRILTPESRDILSKLPGGDALIKADTVNGSPSGIETAVPEGGNPFRKKGGK